jgi:hypothetical protein
LGCAKGLTPVWGSGFGTWEGVAEVLEFGARGEEVDGEDIEAERDRDADGLGELAEVGGGHFAKHLLLVGVDGGVGGGEIARGARLDFEDDEGWAVPGDEVEVAGDARGAPAAAHDGVAEGAEMEEGGVFATFADEEVGGEWGFSVGNGAEGGVGAGFERECELVQAHAARIDLGKHFERDVGQMSGERGGSKSAISSEVGASNAPIH